MLEERQLLPNQRLNPSDSVIVEALNVLVREEGVEEGYISRQHVLRRKVGENRFELRVNTKRAARNLEVVLIDHASYDEKVRLRRGNGKKAGSMTEHLQHGDGVENLV